MPVKVEKRDGKYRVVEVSSGRIARGARGGSADGGGHAAKSKAEAQAAAINRRKRGR